MSTPTFPELDPIEARVLACLVEKEATTPDQYPLTANAVQAACNQKTAREPLMALDTDTVARALRGLEQRWLVRSIHGARSQRYDHRMDEVYSISPEQRCLLALLVLRGPQTAGELATRAGRMLPGASLESVRALLDRLAGRPEPLTLRLPRQPGQREERHVHLLCGAAAAQDAAEAQPVRQAPAAEEDLAERVAMLEAELAELNRRIDGLAARLSGD
ncbi:MAG: YceH family protein [Xanthomonadales bacterium]|nr:YceH family protein [Xanthomonadales bacterium]